MTKNYFKIAWRNLKRNQSYTLINVLGLSLGMACGILIFALVKYHLSFDNFHSNKDCIYRIVTELHEDNIEYSQGVPSPLGKAFRNDYAFAEKTARVVTYKNSLISIPESKDNKKFKEENGVAFAEPEFFDIFNFPLKTGDKRSMLTELNTAVITQNIADKYFAKENPIGKIIRLSNKINFKITGILKNIPANTDRKQEIYLSYPTLKQKNAWLASDSSWAGINSDTQCFILLKPHVLPADVAKVFPTFRKKYLGKDEVNEFFFNLQPLADIHFNTNYDGYVNKKYLWALALIGLFLITTACVNFINLATAQALKRAKEIGVRKVLGSLKTQLFWQFIAETALITVFALFISWCLAEMAIPYINQLFKTELSISVFHDFNLTMFLLLLSVVIVFLAGSYPGLILANFQPVVALKGKLTQKDAGGFPLRRVLVIVQFAISQLLIIGTIVISAQIRYAAKADLGFRKDGIVLLNLPDSSKTKMNTLKTRLMAVAGAEKLSFCHEAPASENNNTTDIIYENRPVKEAFQINTKDADDQYVLTFGLKLVAGRNIFPSDTIREYLVNEATVKKLRLGFAQEIIGKTITVDGKKAAVVGVVKDFNTESFRSNISPIVIAPKYLQYNYAAVRINLNNIKPTLTAMEKVWKETYPDYVYSATFLDEKIAKFYELDNTILRLVQVFAGIAILIGCLGLYGLVSFMAAQKTKEIGVRKVLGASLQNILWLFGKEFSRLLLIAFVIAAPVSWLVMHHWLQEFVYRINIGPWIFLVAILSTFVIAAITVGFRSVKAALANPVKSLRSE
ncbi:MAG: ABC transporter permease [Mucilaginibacter sp.]|uniref:ABC transporter permease n=1 Tax=Mucilaginibacter sp. TaxID=1882438 RepID=UPI0034E5069D